MQVKVFISRPTMDGKPPQILALPAEPATAIPQHLQTIDWRYFATVHADDGVFGVDTGEVEISVRNAGYFVSRYAAI